MKFLKIALIVVGAFLLFVLADLIYFYQNEPYQFARIFLHLSLNESKKSNFDQALAHLNLAKQFHLMQLKKKYNLAKNQEPYPYKNSEIDSKTKQLTLNFLNKNLPAALKTNSTPFLANLYYNLALLAYQNKSFSFAIYLGKTAINLDPELGHLYVELADMLFLLDNKKEAMKVLQECTKFVLPRKQCEDYLSINVRSQSYLKPGYFKQDIFNELKKYFNSL